MITTIIEKKLNKVESLTYLREEIIPAIEYYIEGTDFKVFPDVYNHYNSGNKEHESSTYYIEIYLRNYNFTTELYIKYFPEEIKEGKVELKIGKSPNDCNMTKEIEYNPGSIVRLIHNLLFKEGENESL